MLPCMGVLGRPCPSATSPQTRSSPRKAAATNTPGRQKNRFRTKLAMQNSRRSAASAAAPDCISARFFKCQFTAPSASAIPKPPDTPPTAGSSPSTLETAANSSPPHHFNRKQIPRILSTFHRHMRHQHIDIFFCVPLLPAAPARINRLHIVPSAIQSARSLHLHPQQPLPPTRPHDKVPLLAIAPWNRQPKSHLLRLHQKRRLRPFPQPLRILLPPLPPLFFRTLRRR